MESRPGPCTDRGVVSRERLVVSRAEPSWRLADRLIAGYGLLVAAVAASRLDQPGMAWILGAHLALPFLAWLAARAPDTSSGRAIKALYPVVLIIGLYSAIDVLNGFGAARTYDAMIQHLDARIFGGQPSRDWWRAHPSTFWSTVFHATYLSYYLLVPLPAIAFLATRRYRELNAYMNGLIATYLVCYVAYIFLPVAGPYYQFPRPTGAFVANLPARIVYGALERGSSYGAAFPSSHVAATVAATVGAWFGSRRLGVAMAVPAAMLAVAVVYCQMHYAVDSLTGLILGIGLPWLVRRATVA
jgi:membrane-associated phospholipid phosphatase